LTIDFIAGQLLGEYELLAPTAKGGMAMVWVARRVAGPDQGRLVAIKTLLEADEQTRMALHDEGALTIAIRHPNVATLLETGEHEGVPYLVMEWIDGEPLDVVLQHAAKTRGLPIELSLHWVIQACRGLHAAHELRGADGELRGLIHRDISPQNVMVTYDGSVKLVDFGIAKANQRSTHTQLGQIKGKVAYMSPEQVRGTALDRRVDVFAMGIVLYLLTTGRHPFKAQTPAETIRRICFAGPPLLPSQIVSNYPSALEAIVMKALATDRNDRQATALELSEELASVAATLSECSGAGYLGALLAERIADRRALVTEAIEAADAMQKARNAPTVPPPRSLRPSRGDVEPTLPEIVRDGETSANTFSSLRALILSGVPTTSAGEARVQPIRRSSVRARVALVAAAAALAAAAVLSVGVSPEARTAARAQTSAGAPLRLVQRTLPVLRAARPRD
jgi:eukaryotic-like serine/threonine-protein kinase